MRRRFSCSQSRMKLSLRVFNNSSSTLTLEKSESFIYAARITTIRSKARRWRICIKRSTGCYQEKKSNDISARYISKIDNHFFESAHHERKAIVIQFVRSISRFVIMPVTKQSSVRDDDCRITMLPKRPLVRPAHTRNETRQRRAFRRNFLLCAKERDRVTNERARMKIADESDEVGSRGIKKAQSRRWIPLRPLGVRKIGDRFQTNHCGNVIAARFAAARINETAHLRRLKKRRLLVYKRDETQCLLADF